MNTAIGAAMTVRRIAHDHVHPTARAVPAALSLRVLEAALPQVRVEVRIALRVEFTDLSERPVETKHATGPQSFTNQREHLLNGIDAHDMCGVC